MCESESECVREGVCVFVCVRVRESVCERVREWESVCQSERKCESESQREREGERVRVWVFPLARARTHARMHM